MAKTTTLVGILSDTHGHLSDAAKQALQGVDLIIHAGDVEVKETLDELRQIAPVHVVRGNMDRAPETRHLPLTQAVEVGEVLFYVVHILQDLDINPKAAGFHAVVYGHTHEPALQDRNGVWFINPGSASYPRRVPNPSVAIVEVQGTSLSSKIINLPA